MHLGIDYSVLCLCIFALLFKAMVNKMHMILKSRFVRESLCLTSNGKKFNILELVDISILLLTISELQNAPAGTMLTFIIIPTLTLDFLQYINKNGLHQRYHFANVTSRTILAKMFQIFRSWVTIFHLCPLIAFWSHVFNDMPSFAPNIGVLS